MDGLNDGLMTKSSYYSNAGNPIADHFLTAYWDLIIVSQHYRITASLKLPHHLLRDQFFQDHGLFSILFDEMPV